MNFIGKLFKKPFEIIYSFASYTFNVKIRLNHPDAKVPQKNESGSVGFNIFSVDEIIIPIGHRKLVSTGISSEMSKDFYLKIAPISGLAIQGIDIGAGVIDNNYIGVIKVLVINNGHIPFHVKKGMKIAQIILERCSDIRIDIVDRLSEIERGYGGFGSL